VAALAQRALSFDEPEPFLYHDPSQRGFVSLWSRERVNGRNQTSVQLADLAECLSSHQGKPDRYISVGVFYLPNRRTVSLTRMPMVFADLDTYKIPRLQRLTPEAQLDELLYLCSQSGLPEPSVVVYSGRGLQAKWLLSPAVPRAALPRWMAIQRALNTKLAELGADPAALDASRVLRLDGSVSARSGEVVRVLHRATTATQGGQCMSSGVVGYDIDILAEHLLPLDRDELATLRAQRDAQRAADALEKAAREARRASLVVIPGGADETRSVKRSARPLIPSQLAWDRLEDLRTLASLRGHGAGLPEGQRNTFVFLSACFLAQARLVRELRSEIETLTSNVFAPDWRPWELSSCISTVVSRAEAAARGETVEYDGKSRDPRYWFKNATLVDWLGVTSDEARQLKTILPADEAKRRNTERHRAERRAAGAAERDIYLQHAADKCAQARALKAEGLSSAAIARAMNIGRSTVIGYLKV
jgi:DNA-binding CsgD family transcriptional regulator